MNQTIEVRYQTSDCVTEFTLVSQMLHGEEPEPPSTGRGVAPQATEDRGVRSLLSSSDLSSALSGSSFLGKEPTLRDIPSCII